MRIIDIRTVSKNIDVLSLRGGRLSTAGAEKGMFPAGMPGEGRKGLRDKIAAAGILQDHLDSIR